MRIAKRVGAFIRNFEEEHSGIGVPVGKCCIGEDIGKPDVFIFSWTGVEIAVLAEAGVDDGASEANSNDWTS
jgi:hypothetical protein